jgi:hypothetical protein
MTHEERIAYIRVILGDISEQLLPTATIDLFLSRWELQFDVDNKPENEPLVLWNSTVSCLQYLISKTVSSGNIGTSRTEKIGQEQISVTGGSQLQAWKDLLQYITENPDFIDPSLGGFDNLIIIGGVRKDKFEEVRKDPNSKGAYSVDGIVDYTSRYRNPKNPFVYED